jgi:hypothetical protein
MSNITEKIHTLITQVAITSKILFWWWIVKLQQQQQSSSDFWNCWESFAPRKEEGWCQKDFELSPLRLFYGVCVFDCEFFVPSSGEPFFLFALMINLYKRNLIGWFQLNSIYQSQVLITWQPRTQVLSSQNN